MSAKTTARPRVARLKTYHHKIFAEIDALNARASAQLHINPRNALTTAEMARYASEQNNYQEGLARRAQCHLRLANYIAAEPLFVDAVRLAQNTRNQALEAETLNAFGLMRINQGDYAEAMKLCKQSLGICVAIGDEKKQAAALTAIGIAYWNLGDYENALEQKLHALAITRKHGEEAQEAQLLTNIGTGL